MRRSRRGAGRWWRAAARRAEILSQEETRRRVSVDFTLSDEKLAALWISDGVVVPETGRIRQSAAVADVGRVRLPTHAFWSTAAGSLRDRGGYFGG